MRHIVGNILKGLAILLPVVITVVIAQWLFLTIEGWLRPLLQALLPDSWYWPGFGILAFLAICFAIGLSARLKAISWVWDIPGKILMRIPGASQVYGLVTDLIEVMSGKNFSDESVVMVKLPNSEVELVGIVTKKGGNRNDRMSSLMEEEQIAVFLPMAYNVGGYMIMIPKSCTRSVDMSPAEALQLVLSGGLGKSEAPGTTND